MKTLTLFVMFALTILCSLTLSAQKVLKEGMLKYSISIESSNGEKQISVALNGATLSVYLTKDKSRSEMISTPGTETTVYDNKSGRGFILKEYSGQKLMITTTAENWKQKNQVNSGLNFEVQPGTTSIAGHVCKKALAKSNNGKSYTVYFDPSILIENKQYNNAFSQLAGLPVQYELSSGNLIFRYTLTGFNIEILNATKFDSPKSGFRVMSYEENQQLKKVE